MGKTMGKSDANVASTWHRSTTRRVLKSIVHQIREMWNDGSYEEAWRRLPNLMRDVDCISFLNFYSSQHISRNLNLTSCFNLINISKLLASKLR